jgi:hypothetical protein
VSRIEQSGRLSLRRPKPSIKEVQRLKKKKKKKKADIVSVQTTQYTHNS